MTRMHLVTPVAFLVCLTAVPARSVAQPARALTIVNAGPQGEITQLSEANEIRIVFSEPMVTLGRIPARATAPFVRIVPSIAGSFRWSGTTILIFTPDPKRPLPYATRYVVTVDRSAKAVSGRQLAEPVTFSFTTPTMRLLNTNWYRRGGKAGAPMVIALRFNQPVRTADVLPHISARFEKHDWSTPPAPADPRALAAFNARVAATRVVTQSEHDIALRPTADWDRKLIPPGRDLVVLETTTEVPPGSWVRITTARTIPSPAGPETPGVVVPYTIEVEPAFYVDDFDCTTACNPDRWNPLILRSAVAAAAFARALTVTDVTDRRSPTAVTRAPQRDAREEERDAASRLTLEDGGYRAQPPARTYAVTVDASLQSADGQTLGYTWSGQVENWHQSAFTSFGDGHGVWERGAGLVLPFYARNFRDVTQWAHRLEPSELMPTIRRLQREGPNGREEGDQYAEAPPSEGVQRRLGGGADRIQSHGLDLAAALAGRATGLLWTAVKDGEPIERSRSATPAWPVRASIVQVTNLGISVKDSPQNTLVFVSALDTGEPVPGARVSIIKPDNNAVWTGTTGRDGVALAPALALRDPEDWYRLSFIVTAEKDGDVAYVGSDWNEGVMPWAFDLPYRLHEAEPMLRGTVFTDRGVYRLGEEIHFKAILRHNTPAGIRMLPAGTAVVMTVTDGQDRAVDERTVQVNAWSTAEWTLALPARGSLGTYSVRALLAADRPKPRRPEDLRPGETPGARADEYVPYHKAVHGSFLVAAYRRPDFRVDVALTAASPLAGEAVKGVVTAKYLFGAAMGPRPARWTWTRSPVFDAPPAVRETFTEDRWLFVGWEDVESPAQEYAPLAANDATLSRGGELKLDLQTKLDAGVPYTYHLEGDVEDVSRQHIANRAGILIHPAPFYVGVRRPPYFIRQQDGLATELVAVSPGGAVVPGVEIGVTLTQVQWTSVRRAEGNGFYTWDTERKAVAAGSWTVTSGADPVPLQIPLPAGGYFILEAVAKDADGRRAVTRTSFYSLGAGYTAWARYDHNRIDLVPERKTYKPGETARVMIQSPWERATALVTTEREGIRSHRQFALTSTQQSIDIPITERDIPNVYVSVLLVKGRSVAPGSGDAAAGAPTGGPYAIEDPSDPGKPSFRLGYVELKVEDRSKRLTVAVSANQEEYRPANTAHVRVNVTDHGGRGAASEVTLWAVDYGVLSLTAYRTPDVLGSVYVEKALQVMNTDNRQRIISRRVLTPKGDTEGGGGGAEAGAGALRRDFRVLAFWLGSVVTDERGEAVVDVKLPESLTTYRIMAVAGDRDSRFGRGEAEVRVNKPLTLKPTYPRFLAVGDRAHFGAVVTSQLPEGGEAAVTIKSLDPGVLAFSGSVEQTLTVPAGGSVEARFEAAARTIGRARVQMTVRLNGETDAFEDVIPIEVLASPETVAAYGQVGAEGATASESFEIPGAVVPGFGGLQVEVSSTALVGLGEGARYLVEYPYGCAEQRGSRTLAMALAEDLGAAFKLPGIEPAKLRPAVQDSVKELERFQCPNGGFAYWPGACHSTSPYLTSYLLHVMKTANDLGYTVSPDVRRRGYAYLVDALAATPPGNEGWWPAYTAWQAFAIKVLVEGGQNQDSNITRIYGHRDRMPVFALAYLHDALLAKGETGGARVADLRRRIGNAILPEGGSAHVEELSDPYLLWFWNSNVRSTAIVLNTLVRGGADLTQVRAMVRWMLAARTDGRWRNTQENALALESLVSYYRKYETAEPDFTALARVGAEEILKRAFKGRSTESAVSAVAMNDLLKRSPAGSTQPLTFTREGAGTLFYTARLRYASDELFQQGLDAGFQIQRSYAPYVESGVRPAATTFKAGDLVRVTLSFQLTKERRFVAVTDPLPAGFEPVESWFATTAAALGRAQDDQGDVEQGWFSWWERGGFDHVERHDDRVLLFATRLSEGHHEFSYIVRATTSGTFRTAPARAEEMYEPEVFGRTPTAIVTVK